MSTFVSLDCSLPDNGLSKAIQRTLINVCLPGIFVLLSVPVRRAGLTGAAGTGCGARRKEVRGLGYGCGAGRLGGVDPMPG